MSDFQTNFNDWLLSLSLVKLLSFNLTDDKSILVGVMAWCHQATSHYLSQCWPRSKSPYGVTRPQWVNGKEPIPQTVYKLNIPHFWFIILVFMILSSQKFAWYQLYNELTHWGRVTHMCSSKWTIIGSDNGLLPGRCQTIIWTNAEILLIGPLGTNFQR